MRLASGSCAHFVIDEPQRVPQQTHGVGVQQTARALGLRKKPDQVDRITTKNVCVSDVEAIIINPEICFLADIAPGSPRHWVQDIAKCRAPT